MNELISIIVPIYNGENKINNCIETLLHQEYSNIEILLVDDGSTDNTKVICEKIEKKDRRIKYYYKENSGVSATRNYGIEKSQGKYITFVDCDDKVEEDYISSMYKAIIEQNVDVVRCKVKRITQSNHFIKESLFGLENKKIDNNHINEFIQHLVTSKESINAYCCLLLIKKECIVKFNPNLYFMEDTEFTIRLLQNINSIYLLDKELYIYNYNEESATKNKKNIIKNIKGIVNANHEMKNDLKLNENDEIYTKMNNQSFNLIISKLKLMHRSKILEIMKMTKDIFTIEDVKNIIDNLCWKELSKIKKIEYKLLKNKWYFCLSCVIKITSIKEN